MAEQTYYIDEDVGEDIASQAGTESSPTNLSVLLYFSMAIPTNFWPANPLLEQSPKAQIPLQS